MPENKDINPDPKWQGIHLSRMGLRFSDWEITFFEDGSQAANSSVEITVSVELYVHWLEIALQHLRDAKAAHEALLAAWGTEDIERKNHELERVFASAMQCVLAAAVAVDAFYAMTRGYDGVSAETVEKWKSNRLSRPKRISETLRRAYKLQPRGFKVMRKNLSQLFKWRDWCVHPGAGFNRPVLYEELNVSTEWRFVAFRYVNAYASLGIALSTIAQLLEQAPKRVPDLGEHCENVWPQVKTLVEEWEAEFGFLYPRQETSTDGRF